MIHDDEGLIDGNEVMAVFLYIVIPFQHWAVGILYTILVDDSMTVLGSSGVCCTITRKHSWCWTAQSCTIYRAFETMCIISTTGTTSNRLTRNDPVIFAPTSQDSTLVGRV